MKKPYFYSLIVAAYLLGTSGYAEEAQVTDVRSGEAPQIEVVDVPTAEILSAGTYATTFRFYSDGGLVSRLNLGPLKRVNLGIYFDAQKAIGGGEPHFIRPSLFFKLRMFDGTDVLPALALGYDNQGYLYQRSTKEFFQPEKGVYLVGSHEILVPNLEIHLGVNVNDLDKQAKVYGFAGSTYKFTKSFSLLAEYDNLRSGPENRFNMGGRYYVTPSFNIDFGARNIGRKSDRGAERIVRINYVGNFPF